MICRHGCCCFGAWQQQPSAQDWSRLCSPVSFLISGICLCACVHGLSVCWVCLSLHVPPCFFSDNTLYPYVYSVSCQPQNNGFLHGAWWRQQVPTSWGARYSLLAEATAFNEHWGRPVESPCGGSALGNREQEASRGDCQASLHGANNKGTNTTSGQKNGFEKKRTSIRQASCIFPVIFTSTAFRYYVSKWKKSHCWICNLS